MLETILDLLVQGAVWIVLALAGLVIYSILVADGVKTWIKTTVFLIAGEAVAAFLGWISWQTFLTGNNGGAWAGGIISVLVAIAVIWIAAAHHKTDWKKIEY